MSKGWEENYKETPHLSVLLLSGVGEDSSLESLQHFINCRAGLFSDEKADRLGGKSPSIYSQKNTTLSFCKVFYLVRFRAKGICFLLYESRRLTSGSSMCPQ